MKIQHISSEYFDLAVKSGELYIPKDDYKYSLGDYLLLKETANGKFTGRSCKVRMFFALKKSFARRVLEL